MQLNGVRMSPCRRAAHAHQSANRTYLIIYGPEVDIRFQGLSSDTTREHIFSGVAKAILYQDPRHVLNLRKEMRHVIMGGTH